MNKTGIHSEAGKRRIAKAVSSRLKGKKKDTTHKKKISQSMKNLEICSQCSKKSRFVYGAIIPSLTSYVLFLCCGCFIDQFLSLSPEDKRAVRVLS
jgi:hypothetical protein